MPGKGNSRSLVDHSLHKRKQKAVQLINQNLLVEALNEFTQLSHASPADPEVWYYLGILYGQVGRLTDALQNLLYAIELNPNFGNARLYLARTYLFLGKQQEAENVYKETLKKQPKLEGAYRGLADLLIVQKRQEEAESYLRKGIKRCGTTAMLLAGLAIALRAQGRIKEAIYSFEKLVSLDPDNPAAVLGASVTLPILYEDDAEIDASRGRYRKGLEKLCKNVKRYSGRKEVLEQIQWSSFYLAYQGREDRELQRLSAKFIEELAGSIFPQFCTPVFPPTKSDGRRMRIGYLSHYCHEHTVSYYFSKWIEDLDHNQFETYLYQINPVMDKVSERAISRVDHHKPLSGGVELIAGEVRKDVLDVLIYPEIGMFTPHLWLGALRLAPLQCAAWGHPVTTGLSNIDYFLSSELTEPENADAHYTETLVRLPGLGVKVERTEIDREWSCRDFELPENQILFLCPHSLFKILPEVDYLFAQILKQVKNAVILFFEDHRPEVTRKFINRISRVFREHDLDANNKLVFLQRMDHARYLGINKIAHIMLDLPRWSGGKASLDALSMGLPIVAMQGEFSRGRQSSAMLKLLGVSNLVAASDTDYVDLAIRLAVDTDFRKEMAQAICASAQKNLFDDQNVIPALEKFLLGITAQ